MKINIVNSQKKVKFDTGHLKKTASSALLFLGEKKKELSIYVVDDAKIKVLNRKYLRHDRPTDVIAFSMSEGECVKGAEGILGDVVVSAQTALRQALRLKRSVKDELDLYLVHGILHLFGYNDLDKRDKKKMFDMQQAILTSLRAPKGRSNLLAKNRRLLRRSLRSLLAMTMGELR